MVERDVPPRRHWEIARATILKIADSLATEEPLRKAFLSDSPIAEILGNLPGG